MSPTSLAAMPLYSTIARVRNELDQLGTAWPLAIEQLYSFDQIHYRGTDAVGDAAAALALGADDHVLDVGAGIGGPARFLAHTTGCRVAALELQEEMHALGAELTSRCGLSSRVAHLCGDALTHPLAEGTFDAAVSWLAVHHIPDRPRLLQRIAAALRPGGRLYIEDLCERAPLAGEDAIAARETLVAVSLTSADAFADDLSAAGFADIDITDMRDEWAAFCATRAAGWRAGAERHRRVHGDAIYETLDRFFTTVQRLFDHGSMGGVRLVAVARRDRPR